MISILPLGHLAETSSDNLKCATSRSISILYTSSPTPIQSYTGGASFFLSSSSYYTTISSVESKACLSKSLKERMAIIHS